MRRQYVKLSQRIGEMEDMMVFSRESHTGCWRGW